MIEQKGLIEQFKKHLVEKTYSINTIISYNSDVEAFLDFCKIYDFDLDNSSFVSFIIDLKDSGYDSKTLSRKTNSLKIFANFLNINKIANIDTNIIHSPFKQISKEQKFLTVEQITNLLKNSIQKPKIYFTFCLILQTGLKINELCELKVGDIDLIKNVIFVNQNGRKGRSILINLKLHFVLKDYLNSLVKSKKSDYLLQNNKDKKYHIRNLRGLLSKQFSVLKLKFSVNDLRNTFILGQLREGNSIEFVQKISGHKSIAATKKYLRYLKNYKDKGKKEVFEV